MNTGAFGWAGIAILVIAALLFVIVYQVAIAVAAARAGLIGWHIVRETIGRITRWRMPPSLAGPINAVGMLAVLAYVVVMIVVQIRAP